MDQIHVRDTERYSILIKLSNATCVDMNKMQVRIQIDIMIMVIQIKLTSIVQNALSNCILKEVI